jgi:hypothetical protein
MLMLLPYTSTRIKAKNNSKGFVVFAHGITITSFQSTLFK